MRILIIGSVWVEPNSSAAGSRMLQLIHAYQCKGWDVHFACAAGFSENAVDLSALGVKTQTISLNCSAFNVFVSGLQPDVVVFDRFMTEEQYAWRVAESCPNALRVLNTEDLHCLRYAREQALKEDTNWEDVILESDFTKREVAAIFRSDLCIMISDFEMQLLQDVFHVPNSLLHYCPFMLGEEGQGLPDFDARKDFLFIGNFKHKPNADAVMVLKKEVWPHLRKLQPTAQMHIFGAYPEQKHLQLSNPSEKFLVHGRAESATVAMQSARVLLAPLRFGAGLKGKLVEAMQNACPSVTTSVGAEGIGKPDDWPGFVENEFESFAQQASTLYSNKLLWSNCVTKGNRLINTSFRNKDYATELAQTILEAKKKMASKRKQNFVGQMLMHHSLQSTKYLSRFIEEKNKK